ncbi:MAG: sigma-54 dependent transcriptional regulator [Treponemataceae bacterium]
MAAILIVDDKPNILKVMGAVLAREGYIIDTASDGREALTRVSGKRPDLIITDIQMPGLSGIELFHAVCGRGLDVPFIFITAYASVPEAVSTIKQGAIDYLTKPVDYAELKRTIRRVLSAADENRCSELSEDRFLVGSGEAMKALYARIEAVAPSASSVLIRGENGTGKELVARSLHRSSRFREGPFIPVNCAAFNANLLESELFGYEAGAFTGAQKRKIGFFETASGGTLFLDEISETSPDLQIKLLRVLQEKAFSRVGGTELVRADFRLIAATNRDIEALVSRGLFRQDLYYRLNVVPIAVPPLRNRFEDVGELVAHFVDRVCLKEELPAPQIDEDFIDLLRTHRWPGNVRELENLIERLIVLYRPARLEPLQLFSEVPELFALPQTEGTERDALLEALRVTRGNKTDAAKILGMPRRTLYNKLLRFSIREEEFLPIDTAR